MTRTVSLAGGCACGSVRYTCSAPALVQLICHCRDCQRASGSAFAACLVVPTDRLQLDGAALKAHTLESALGRTMRRLFCGTCGSPVAIVRPETPLVRFVHASSLDDPSVFSPTCEVWVSRASAWHPHLDSTVKFQEGPSPETVGAPIAAYFAARD